MQFNNGSYYQWSEGNKLEASIIHHGKEDGVHPNMYGLQIHTRDGGLLAIGYLPKSGFDIHYASTIVNAALKEDQDFDWWAINGDGWFSAMIKNSAQH